VPYHLIDIVDPGFEFNIYEFQKQFLEAYDAISERGKKVILCGGSGMYLDSILRGYHLRQVPENLILRSELLQLNKVELQAKLKSYKTPHNLTDLDDLNRLIRAIEIAEFEVSNPITNEYPQFNSLNFGIHFERLELRERITSRLKDRLENGMAEEVRGLLDKGYSAAQLMFYGLEYKYVTQFVIGDLRYNDLFQKLNSAIHQFARRQMTWFRRMEKNGVKINWIDGSLSSNEKIEFILNCIKKSDHTK
jgi:tRNA dimethylallyltransferase